MSFFNTLMVTVSAVSTAVAAIAALVTTKQNHKSIKMQEVERHAMVKPQFVVTQTFMDSMNKTLKIEVRNIGYSVLKDIIAKWEGHKEVGIELERYIDDDKTIAYSILLKLEKECYDNKDIKGKLILNYIDVLGTKYEDYLNIVIKKVYNELGQIASLKMECIVYKKFS